MSNASAEDHSVAVGGDNSGSITIVQTSTSHPIETLRRHYLQAFLNLSTERAPVWDKQVFTQERIMRSEVQIAERVGDLELEPSDEGDERIRLRKIRVKSISDLLNMIVPDIAIRQPQQRDTRSAKNVFILLGRPAGGKSITTLQLAWILADKAMEDSTLPIPIYINLAHFTAINSLGNLVRQSMGQGCPRYLMPETTSSPIDSISVDKLLNQESDIKKLFIFDGIDEMPVRDSQTMEQNARISALGDFIRNNIRHTFIVTCRVSDYVQLRKYGNYDEKFQIAKYEILPWKRQMLQQYLNLRAVETGIPSGKVDELLTNVYGSDAWGQFNNSPLLGVLLFPDRDHKIPNTIADAWNKFIKRFLSTKFPDDAAYHVAISALEEFGYKKTLDPAITHDLDSKIKQQAIDTGLLEAGQPNPEFVIKPLQQYFAARFIWKAIADGDPRMNTLEITHAKLRVAFQIAAEIAGDDTRMSEYLARRLGATTDPYACASLVELSTTCVTSDRLQKSKSLQQGLVDAIKTVVKSDKAGEFELCLKGIKRNPDLFRMSFEPSLAFMGEILLAGSPENQQRLFQILASQPQIALTFPGLFVTLVGKFMNSARLGGEIERLADLLFEQSFDKPIYVIMAQGVFRLAHVICLSIYLYSIYLISLWLAHQYTRLSAGWLGLPWIAPDLALLPMSASEWFVRLLLIVVAIGWPWWMVSRMARREYRFHHFIGRLAVLLVTGSFTRFVLLVPLLGISTLNTISVGGEYVLVSILFLLPPLLLLTSFLPVVQATDAPRAVSGAPPSNEEPVIVVSLPPDIRPPELPEALPEPRELSEQLGKLYAAVVLEWNRYWRKQISKAKIGSIAAMLGIVTLIVTLLFLGYNLLVIITICLTALLVLALKKYLYDPYRAAMSLPKRVRRYLSKELNENYQHALNEAVDKICSERTPMFIRRSYIRAIGEIRWDRSLLDRFEHLAELEDLPKELRNRISIVKTRKRKEVEQNTNPEH